MVETTRVLASFVTDTGYDDMPEKVRYEAHRAFVNYVGCCYGGTTNPAFAVALAFAEETTGPRTTTVIGTDSKLDPVNATLIGSLGSCAHSFDDTHLETVVHPTCMVGPAVLAVAEQRRVSGRDFIAALVHGIEVQCRIAQALLVPPAEGEVGWYSTGVVGGIGAAAAAAKLMGLDHEQTVNAIGIAAVQAAGFRQAHATMCIGFVPASAARAGIQAALLAEKGFDCSQVVLEGTNGFFQVFSHKANPVIATSELGERWEVLANAYKPYPSGVVTHAVIDACLNIARANDIDGERIDTVTLRVNPMCLVLCNRPNPQNGIQAMVSVHHWTAASLLRKAAGLAECTDECVHDPKVAALRAKVKLVEDPQVAGTEAYVTVALTDGSTLEEHVADCTGSHRKPMTDGQLSDKFVGQAEPIVGTERAKTALDACWEIGKSGNAGGIAALLTKSA